MEFPPASEPLAQAVEHLPFKQRVAGSNPARLTRFPPQIQAVAISPQITVCAAVCELSVFSRLRASCGSNFTFSRCAQVLLHFFLRFPDLFLVDDTEAPVHGRRFVTGDLHGDYFGNARP